MNPAWIGPLIGLISLCLAVTFFLVGRRARLKGPTWETRSNNLVRGFASKLPELDILFRNDKVDTLTVTRLAFWNRGMATIDRNDIAPADPLRIAAIGSARLLDVKIVQANNEPSRFEVAPNADGKTASLGFDFLDRDHGAVIQIVHTGTSGNDITVAGTIKGAGAPARRRIKGIYLPLPTSADFDRKIKPRTRRRITRVSEVVAALSFLIAGVCVLVAWLSPSQWAPIADGWKTFRTNRWFAAGALQVGAAILGYFLVFVLVHAIFTFGAATLPPDLMALGDDPLEK